MMNHITAQTATIQKMTNMNTTNMTQMRKKWKLMVSIRLEVAIKEV